MSTTENLRRSSRIKARVKEEKLKKNTSFSSDEDINVNSINAIENELKDVEENIQKPNYFQMMILVEKHYINFKHLVNEMP